MAVSENIHARASLGEIRYVGGSAVPTKGHAGQCQLVLFVCWGNRAGPSVCLEIWAWFIFLGVMRLVYLLREMRLVYMDEGSKAYLVRYLHLTWQVHASPLGFIPPPHTPLAGLLQVGIQLTDTLTS